MSNCFKYLVNFSLKISINKNSFDITKQVEVVDKSLQDNVPGFYVKSKVSVSKNFCCGLINGHKVQSSCASKILTKLN